MTLYDDVRLDLARFERTGVAEAVFSESKDPEQIGKIVRQSLSAGGRLLLTRLSSGKHAALEADLRDLLDYDMCSRTAILGGCHPHLPGSTGICIVAAGTSDLPVALEVHRTLNFHGHEPSLILDVGVAGLWRLLEQIDHIRKHAVIIVVAGMEGALFSVLAGLVDALVIAVPTSVGYGVSEKGVAALSSALASCAPGIVTVNIDNGFGAASAALKIIRRWPQMTVPSELSETP